MKIQIKTLNQKSLVLDIEETKTVYDLKKELSCYPDIGVKPEFQKVIYAGKILGNDDTLSSYNIDVKKFLVVMILKQPLEESPKASQSKQKTTAEGTEEEETPNKECGTSKTSSATPATESEFKTPLTAADSKKDEIVSQIVGMGYPESDVRRALAASFYNPERAIEYLVEGIPTSPPTPDGETSDTDADLSLTPFEVFRTDPMFRNLRKALQQHPELLDAAIEKMGETNPSLLNLINENQQEFLSMLIDGSDDEDLDDDEMEGDEDD